MRTATLTIRPYKSHQFVLDLRSLGKGRKFFNSRDEARAARKQELRLLRQHGAEAIGLPPREMAEFITARNKLAAYGKTVTEAADFLIHHEENVRRCKVTVKELSAELIEAKRRDGRSQRYINDLRLRLSHFGQKFGDRFIATIGPEELQRWLHDLPHSPQSRVNYRTVVGALFSHAANLGMIASNPVLRIAKPKIVDKPPGILTVDETRVLLDTARRIEPDIIPAISIGIFAGLREAEIRRLDWSDVKLARKHIDLSAEKAKSARRRLVQIQPNLMEWLRPYSGRTGPVRPVGYRDKLERVIKEAGIQWKHNAARHSYASYRLAATTSAPQVALELGQQSAATLFAHYRELVMPDEAARYWDIRPPEGANVVAFSGGSAS